MQSCGDVVSALTRRSDPAVDAMDSYLTICFAYYEYHEYYACIIRDIYAHTLFWVFLFG